MAAIFGRDAGRVDVVLGRSGFASPFVVGGIRAGQVGSATSLGGDGNSLGLGSRVIGTADSSAVGHLVANQDSDLGGTSNAEGVVVVVGPVELTVLAMKAANRLASRTLGGGPVGLLVAGRASVRAVHAFGTAVAPLAVGRCDGLNVGKAEERKQSGRLDTGPTTEAKVVKRDCAIV